MPELWSSKPTMVRVLSTPSTTILRYGTLPYPMFSSATIQAAFEMTKSLSSMSGEARSKLGGELNDAEDAVNQLSQEAQVPPHPPPPTLTLYRLTPCIFIWPICSLRPCIRLPAHLKHSTEVTLPRFRNTTRMLPASLPNTPPVPPPVPTMPCRSRESGRTDIADSL